MWYGRYNSRKQNPADIVILLINALAFITGVIYLVYGSGNIYWNIYGIYLMAVMVCNAVYALFDYKHDIKGYLYLGAYTVRCLFHLIYGLLLPTLTKYCILFMFCYYF